MLTMRLVLCFAFLAVCATAYSQTPPQAPRVETKEQAKNAPPAKTNAEGNPQAPAIPPAVPLEPETKIDAGKASQNTQEGSDEASEYWTVAGHRVKVTDTLLVVFTGLLFFATVFLYFATQGLVAGAETTSERQLRAYVGANPTKINGPPTLCQFFSMINHGQTPAHEVMETALMDMFPYPLPPNFNFPPLPNPRSGRVVLHPHTTDQAGLAGAVRAFTDLEIAHMTIGNEFRLYIYGRITYVDVFKKFHTTKFCHSFPGGLGISKLLRGISPPDTRLITETADQHNEAD